jgi:citrate lyase beta subunit
LITDDPVLAANADRAGVDRIGPDLERVGKTDRQSGLDTRLSRHKIDDVAKVGRVLTHAKLFVRVNPINAGTTAEVDAVIARGAGLLMLPFFRSVDEVEKFVRLVDGRAAVMLLLETASAVVVFAKFLPCRASARSWSG